MDFLRQNAAHIAAWLPPLFLALASVGALAAVWFGGKRSRGRMACSVQLLVGALIALAVMFGPMRPLFTSARRLDSWTGRPAPDVVFHDVATGAERRLAGLRGRAVVVNLWATWCPPCRAEMPTLNRLQKEYAARGLAVVTLSDEPPDRIRSFLERHAPDTINGVTSFEWLPVQKFRPFTFVVDRKGVVVEYFFGAQEYATFEQRIRPYL